MKTGTWNGYRLLGCALLLLTGLGCTDSRPSAPTSAGSVRFHESDDGDDDGRAQRVCNGGVIAATLVITENARLTCDVICTNATGPCIQFGKNHITLSLNGFTMTGPATPPSDCAASPFFGPGNPGTFPFDGISTAGFDHVKIRGPGMVQKFRRHGIFVFESEKASVEHVTSHYNCFSGIFLGLANHNDVKENVSVRNGIASGAAPCGGNCVSNSNHNRIRRNHYHGNGSVAAGANDFGIGLVGTSSNNVVDENNIGGNINGILLTQPTTRNLIRGNIIAGNPPVQVSFTAGAPVGADIRDASAAGANTFRENWCITYEGATFPRPCPKFPRFRGDR